MKYQPKLPERNSNVTPQNALRELVTLLGGLSAIVLLLYGLIGLFIDMAVAVIDPATEVWIYQSSGIDQLAEVKPLPLDTAAGKALRATETATQNLLSDLAQCADLAYGVDLKVEESKAVNALAWPGGHIVVLSGLLDKMESQNGLAFVLAHELAHFKNRDHLRSMGRGVVILSLAVLIGGANGELSDLIMSLSNVRTMAFSQTNESAADATALDILNCHYGHIGGASEFFNVISQVDDNTDFTLMHYFSSHPQIQQRIVAIEQLRQSRGYHVGETLAL
jgi:Zn-dependent protease with chaperone function